MGHRWWQSDLGREQGRRLEDKWPGRVSGRASGGSDVSVEVCRTGSSNPGRYWREEHSRQRWYHEQRPWNLEERGRLRGQEVGRPQARVQGKQVMPEGLLYHVLLGVLNSLPQGRRGSPTRDARILTAGSQTMKRSDPEGLLETILQVETRPKRGSNTLCLLLRNSLSLVPRCPGVC